MQPKPPIAPKDILELSHTSPIVQYHLTLWEAGHVTWEQMLMLLVHNLYEQVDRLEKTAIKVGMLKPPRPFDL